MTEKNEKDLFDRVKSKKWEMAKLPAGSSLGCLFSWIGTKGDYESAQRKSLTTKGWRRYTSTFTNEGKLMLARLSVVMWGGIAAYVAYRFLRPERKLKLEKEPVG
ncbi:uncharacterized protein [Mytilus edulis]|uniref:uncharacterized protein n=1 Tax=Mytilus edulis TaxID=6550 RepID=UPI0039F0E823